ncbi:hypothetical protein GE061_008457 [Apolygus lucorum]|uniref:Carboxylesterase type B domain-containing protein n=1 Tax=Apolygus lucorum TaxID=248454 RepID=A0A8S9WTH5_APOLU|nr:hypothetical protein GE061_008457 [Apolygus lucorum]
MSFWGCLQKVKKWLNVDYLRPQYLRSIAERVSIFLYSFNITNTINFSLALTSLACDSPMLTNVAHAPAGEIVGTERISREGRPYHAFFGIPFAQPPVGKLRFRPPERIPKLEGTFKATTPPKNCLQNLDPNSSEDCLYLNVFRPKATEEKCTKSGLPVLVYVYGGGFSAGNQGPPNSADYLMDKDVILVSPNYRLGIFGFPSFGNHILPGNYGLKDLILALRWVKENISAFGGDPDNVTAFGGSAGAALTHILLKAPAAEYLVTKGFSYSGSINPFWSQVISHQLVGNTLKVAKNLGCCKTSCSATQNVFECMQKANAADLLSKASVLSATSGDRMVTFAAVIEPKDAPDAVITGDLSSKPCEKPWMTSVTNGEYSVFYDSILNLMPNGSLKVMQKNLLKLIKSIVGHSTKGSTAIIRKSKLLKSLYFQGNFSDGLAKFFMDLFFIYPQIYNIKKHEGPKWMSNLEYQGELSLGVDSRPGHADQGLFILNYRNVYVPDVPLNETEKDYNMVKRMVGYLVNFANFSDPTPEGSDVRWDKFSKNEILRMTGDGDFMGDKEYYSHFGTVYKNLKKIMGWCYS